MEQDVNRFWEFVKARYPDARFERWFPDGELHFWPNGEAERKGENLGSCFRDERARMVTKTRNWWG